MHPATRAATAATGRGRSRRGRAAGAGGGAAGARCRAMCVEVSPLKAKRRIRGYSFFSPDARFTSITPPWTGRRCRRRRCASARDGAGVESDPLGVVRERSDAPPMNAGGQPGPLLASARRLRRAGISFPCRSRCFSRRARHHLPAERHGRRTTRHCSTGRSHRCSSRQ